MERLEVINAMLRAVGEDIVTSANTNHPDVQTAGDALDGIIRKALLPGWWFNRNWNVTLSPDVSGRIILPTNQLRVRCYHPYGHLIPRGKYLYDPTASHDQDIIGGPVIADITINMKIEDLPASAADYIKAYAVYRFYVDDDGDADKANDYNKEMGRAFTVFRGEHLRMMAFNAKNTPRARELLYRINPSYGRGYASNPNYPGGRRLGRF